MKTNKWDNSMINDWLSNTVTDKIISDLRKIIERKKGGKITLDNYLTSEMEAPCMDFAEIYEASIDIQTFINEQRRNGTNILINETDISVL